MTITVTQNASENRKIRLSKNGFSDVVKISYNSISESYVGNIIILPIYNNNNSSYSTVSFLQEDYMF